MSHTPGPWTARAIGETDLPVKGCGDGETPQEICEITGLGDFLVADAVYGCDASLIAAAPDMLALLRRLRGWDMLDTTSDGDYWKGEIDEAIRKATEPHRGRSGQ